MDVKASQSVKDELHQSKTIRWRNLIAFFLLGLCNNYGYVIMLSAARDLLDRNKEEPSVVLNISNSTTNQRICNEMSTGAILLANIIPGLLVKFTVPFLPFYINFRMALCVVLQIFSFLCVAFSGNLQWLTIGGVALTSLASGLGEVTIMSHSHSYARETIGAWSSGTGAAGIFGSASYIVFQLTMKPETTMLVVIVIPVLEAIAFWAIMAHPKDSTSIEHGMNSQEKIIAPPKKSITGKLKLVPGLMIFIIPLTLVYLFEYFINQGLYELIQYKNIFLDYKQQYSWYQFDYQIGVFISRSSVTFISFRKIWLMALFQFVNIIIFATEAIYSYIPSIWIIFVLIFWEGLLGGAAYVNTYYNMDKTISAENLKESLGIVTMSDAIGITIAGFLAMPAHDEICKLPLR